MKLIISAAAVMAALFASVSVAAPTPVDQSGIEVDAITHGNPVVFDLAGFDHYVLNVEK